MKATEMHDLLLDCLTYIEREASLFQPGTVPCFTHIYYCRFCGYSSAHAAAHGHGAKCLYDRLQRATDTSTPERT